MNVDALPLFINIQLKRNVIMNLTHKENCYFFLVTISKMSGQKIVTRPDPNDPTDPSRVTDPTLFDPTFLICIKISITSFVAQKQCVLSAL